MHFIWTEVSSVTGPTRYNRLSYSNTPFRLFCPHLHVFRLREETRANTRKTSTKKGPFLTARNVSGLLEYKCRCSGVHPQLLTLMSPVSGMTPVRVQPGAVVARYPLSKDATGSEQLVESCRHQIYIRVLMRPGKLGKQLTNFPVIHVRRKNQMSTTISSCPGKLFQHSRIFLKLRIYQSSPKLITLASERARLC